MWTALNQSLVPKSLSTIKHAGYGGNLLNIVQEGGVICQRPASQMIPEHAVELNLKYSMDNDFRQGFLTDTNRISNTLNTLANVLFR